MTGGPVDVVIETGIAAPQPSMVPESPGREDVVQRVTPQPIFTRTPRAATGGGDSAAE